MKAWMSVAAAVVDRLGRRRAMFRRWKKAVLVIWLTWGRKERVGSRIKVTDFGGGGDGGAVNVKGDVLSG